MRSMWSGYLGFGLVQMPVKLFKATESHDIGFRQHHGPDCLGQVGQVRVCKDCGAAVDYGDIVKGIEHEGQTVILTPDDVDALKEEQGKQIEILQFVDAYEIDPMMYEQVYYLGAPDGPKVYALLVESMTQSGLVALARFTMRSKTQLAVIRVVEGVMVLHTLLWADELRDPEVPGLGKNYTAAELKAARAVVDSMVAPFDPTAHRDDYRDRLAELIEARAGDIEFVVHEPEAVEEVSDLLAALEASVARHPAGKKKAAKKAPAKKAAARKKRVA
jgi:DNA end-binding protein Ku